MNKKTLVSQWFGCWIALALSQSRGVAFVPPFLTTSSTKTNNGNHLVDFVPSNNNPWTIPQPYDACGRFVRTMLTSTPTSTQMEIFEIDTERQVSSPTQEYFGEGEEEGETKLMVSSTTKKSKYAKEFEVMMDEFKSFTSFEIDSLPSLRYRSMLYGSQAGLRTPKVYRAFEVLFEDLAPVRFAGRMIYRYLRRVIETSVQARRDEEIRLVHDHPDLTVEEVRQLRKTYEEVKDLVVGVVDSDGEGAGSSFTWETLSESLNLLQFREGSVVLSSSWLDELTKQDSSKKNGGVTLEDFIVALKQGVQRSDQNDGRIPPWTNVLEELQQNVRSMRENGNYTSDRHNISLSAQKQKYNDRFNEMIMDFKRWEQRLPPDTGTENRRMEIVMGCFEGAKNKDIVNALKIVYIDYTPLRIAGNLVFQLVTRVVNNILL